MFVQQSICSDDAHHGTQTSKSIGKKGVEPERVNVDCNKLCLVANEKMPFNTEEDEPTTVVLSIVWRLNIGRNGRAINKQTESRQVQVN